MFCKHFGICGSCKFDSYQEQLNFKIEKTKLKFETLIKDFEIFESKEKFFRARAEFRLSFDENNNLKYSMFTTNKKLFFVDECFIVDSKIFDLMPKLLESINSEPILKSKIFAVEFLVGSNNLLVTLIYHRQLDENWLNMAQKLEIDLDINIIGRSKKQQIVVSQNFVDFNFKLLDRELYYQFFENSFVQPNLTMNQNMINWVFSNIKESKRDLLELYCGAGNFTIALASKFNRVFATEISKISIKSLTKNIDLNSIQNISFARLSSEEFTNAINKTREFFRLREIDLDSFDFETIFVDPPRSGLDDMTRDLVKRFDKIIYISCNQESLKRDLDELSSSHTIEKFAIFDQFPYSEHIESGAILSKK